MGHQKGGPHKEPLTQHDRVNGNKDHDMNVYRSRAEISLQATGWFHKGNCGLFHLIQEKLCKELESWCFTSLKLMMAEDYLLIIPQPCLSHRVMPFILVWPFHYAAVPCYCVAVQFKPLCLHCHLFFFFLIICFPYRNVHSALLLAWRVSRELYADPLLISHFESGGLHCTWRPTAHP